VTNGGMDTFGYAYPEALMGSSTLWAGVAFAFGGAGTTDAAAGGTVTLPSGNFSTVDFLGAAVNGNHMKQTFVVTYTDNTTDTFIQSMSDWGTPQKYTGESNALTLSYQLRPAGTTLNHTTYLYGYSFAINNAKTVQSIALPNNRDVVVLSITLVP